jgi:hypothetical protein
MTGTWGASRRAAAVLRALAILVLLAVVAAVTWTAMAHHERTGTWSVAVWDPAWWQSAMPGQPLSAAQLGQQAARFADRAEQDLWGPGGVLERCQHWWQEHADGAPTHPSSPVASAPSTPVASAPAGQAAVESAIADARRAFADGLGALQRARPQPGRSADERRDAAYAAHLHFLQAQEILAQALPPYRAQPGADARLCADGDALQSYAQQMAEVTAPAPDG